MDLVHMDLCGPIEESRGGNKYIATFKDDYTGMSWIELTATKKNLAEVIKARLNLLQTQKDKKIKVIRTDNGKEYVNTRHSTDIETNLNTDAHTPASPDTLLLFQAR